MSTTAKIPASTYNALADKSNPQGIALTGITGNPKTARAEIIQLQQALERSAG